MNPLLAQFISESRDCLQSIGERLLQLERSPADTAVMNELFRIVHTLKGNSGLFEFPEMTRVLHAGEDLMDAVRDGRVTYSQALADRLLDAMDFVGVLLDEIGQQGAIGAHHGETADALTRVLRAVLATGQSAATPAEPESGQAPTSGNMAGAAEPAAVATPAFDILSVPDEIRQQLYRRMRRGESVCAVIYAPDADCFFKGEDPLHQVRQIADIAWRRVRFRGQWPELEVMDAYRCELEFQALTTARMESLRELFRYVSEQVTLQAIDPAWLRMPVGKGDNDAAAGEFVAAALSRLDSGDLDAVADMARQRRAGAGPETWEYSALAWLLLCIDVEPADRPTQRALLESILTQQFSPSSGDVSMTAGQGQPVDAIQLVAFDAIRRTQLEILSLPDEDEWVAGRLNAVGETLTAAYTAMQRVDDLSSLKIAIDGAVGSRRAALLKAWLEEQCARDAARVAKANDAPAVAAGEVARGEGDLKFGRRAEDNATTLQTLKVDQAKVDRLMNLIGEFVVANNALPYLASRAETQYGVRELSREIKAHYAVFHRVAEEMQDAIMQVRMTPVSFVFQRFPRLVRDISRKLDKQVNLVLEGEQTEADKNVIEAIGDPLIHIVRNSLDHGIESPAARVASGKPPAGTLTISARQEADRVVIAISDDGKGIDPAVIKRKALEKGIIDEATAARMSEQEAINLVFAPGFSTAEAISDLSGRGVGMDVVRTSVERVNGTLELRSQVGCGTTIQLALPLSMALSKVMVVESDGQLFGVPVDTVVETVRIPQRAVRNVKQHATTVLRDRIVPLASLNQLLAINREQVPNQDGEVAVMVAKVHGSLIGLVVDRFRETIDIVLKPLQGLLGGLPGYAGSALLGDGSVLMVLNLKELV